MPPPPPPPPPPAPSAPPPPPAPPPPEGIPAKKGLTLEEQLRSKKSKMKISEAVEAEMWDQEYSHGRAGHVGLSNQGATCYLNSLLQALFMLPEFRAAVFSCEGDELPGAPLPAEDSGEGAAASPLLTDEELAAARELRVESIPHQLQLLFARLQLSVRRAVGTVNVTRSFGWGSAEAFQQHDVLELFTQLLEALTSSVAAAPSNGGGGGGGGGSAPSALFTFEMSDVLRYTLPDSGEPVRRVRRNFEKNISLYLDETTSSLEQAVQRYVSAETIEGFVADEADGALVTAFKELRFASLPPCLLFNLQRFSFDWQRQRRVKVDQPCAFPLSLDMARYTDPDCTAGVRGQSTYQLSAVLIHSGTAYSGHYFAYIRDADTGAWYEFNDEKVSLLSEGGDAFDPAFFEGVFGGNASAKHGGSGTSSMSAYGLLYSRASISSADGASSSANVAVPAELSAVVAAENVRWEASRAEFLKRKNSVVFEVHFEPMANSVTVALDKAATLPETVAACREAVGAALAVQPDTVATTSLPRSDCCRLRPCSAASGEPEGRPLGGPSQDTGDSEGAVSLEALGLWRRSARHVLLEVRDDEGAGSFPKVPDSQLDLQVVLYTAEAPAEQAFAEPVPVTVRVSGEGDLSPQDVADQIARALYGSEVAAERPHLTLMVVDLKTEHARLSSGAAVAAALSKLAADSEQAAEAEPLSLYAEPVQSVSEQVPGVGDGKSSAMKASKSVRAAFEARASLIVLPVAVECGDTMAVEADGVGESVLELRISHQETVRALRIALVPLVGMEASQLVICSTATGRELRDGSVVLNSATIDLSRGVSVRQGTPLETHQCRVELLKTSSSLGPHTSLGTHVVDDTFTVAELVAALNAVPSTAGKLDIGADAVACVRVRHVRLDGRLGRICAHGVTLKSCLGGALDDGCRLVLQKLEYPESIEAGSTVVSLRQWFAATSTIGPATEMIVARKWSMLDLLTHIEALQTSEAERVQPETPEPESELEPESQPEAVPSVQVIRPWGYQMRDPSSLHLTNWSQPGFAKRLASGADAGEAAWTLVDGDELVWRERPVRRTLRWHMRVDRAQQPINNVRLVVVLAVRKGGRRRRGWCGNWQGGERHLDPGRWAINSRTITPTSKSSVQTTTGQLHASFDDIAIQ